VDEDDLRFCFRFIIIMQMANAHHKRYIPGAGPHNPYRMLLIIQGAPNAAL